jgi:RNA polymerase sigma-70 factor (ECF subfamily)
VAPIRAPNPATTHGVVARFPQDRLSDAQLVSQAARGDSRAQGAVWDRYSGMVRGVLYGSLGGDSALEDLLQEVFLVFCRAAAAGQIREGNALRGYLVGVAVRLVALELRRRRLRRWVGLSAMGELPDLPVSPADDEGREALRALHRVLDQLSTRRRLAFVLRHVQGMELLEVASALKMSESTARRELGRAQRQLAALARGEPALSHYLEARNARECGRSEP